jgi:hypothetical protein
MSKRFAASRFRRDASLPAWARPRLRDRAQVYKRSNPERFKYPDPAIRPIRIASDIVLSEASNETANGHSVRTVTMVVGVAVSRSAVCGALRQFEQAGLLSRVTIDRSNTANEALGLS